MLFIDDEFGLNGSEHTATSVNHDR
jgi:hypothetical protein